MQGTGRHDLDFVQELPATPVLALCDARQIAQALTNILKNAVEAIEGRQAADHQDLPRGKIELQLLVSEGAVTIRVGDNGKGLPHEDRHRLTEPYVTTRAKGTGLGLAIVKKIMEDHHGQLLLADNPGGGAAVTLVLQRAMLDTAVMTLGNSDGITHTDGGEMILAPPSRRTGTAEGQIKKCGENMVK